MWSTMVAEARGQDGLCVPGRFCQEQVCCCGLQFRANGEQVSFFRYELPKKIEYFYLLLKQEVSLMIIFCLF